MHSVLRGIRGLPTGASVLEVSPNSMSQVPQILLEPTFCVHPAVSGQARSFPSGKKVLTPMPYADPFPEHSILRDTHAPAFLPMSWRTRRWRDVVGVSQLAVDHGTMVCGGV